MSFSPTLVPSKSHTLRAVYFGALAKGKTVIKKSLKGSPDVEKMVRFFSDLLPSSHIQWVDDDLVVKGVGNQSFNLWNVVRSIDVGNSGIGLRFLGALMSQAPYCVSIRGDESLCAQRPVSDLLHALSQLGVSVNSQKGFAPFSVCGPWTQTETTLLGQDSQPVSACLMGALSSEKGISLAVRDPGEKPWVDLTLSWFDFLGLSYQREGYSFYKVEGKQSWDGFHYHVPADFSSLLFPVTLALALNEECVLSPLNWEDPQGDKNIFFFLEKNGWPIEIGKNYLKIFKRNSHFPCLGGQVSVDEFIDGLPLLSILGTMGSSPLKMINASSARTKESDRIKSVVTELSKFGVCFDETCDSLTVYPTTLKKPENKILNSFFDHRMVLTLVVAKNLANDPDLVISNQHCVEKTYPDYKNLWKQWGDFLW